MSALGYAETDRKMKIERPLCVWKRTFVSLQPSRQNAANSSRQKASSNF